MLKVVPFANALAFCSGAASIVCAIVGTFAPDLVIGLFQSWVHTINLDAIRASAPPTLLTMAGGVLSISAFAWLFGAALAWLYNRGSM